jgi:2-aminoadipate transaminase
MNSARRMTALRTSQIREILKLTHKPVVISFAGGLPAAERFPVDQMIAVSTAVLRDSGAQALQYSTTEGFAPLREAIAERMNRVFSAGVHADRVLITSGSQQGLDLTGKIFLDEGDVVLCESPTYLGAINAFRAYSPRFVEVPTDDEGMVIAELEQRLAETDRAKFIYVVPDFQNPSGRTWSRQRREQFMAVVRRTGIPVIEDCPYAEIRFEGETMPPLISHEGGELVVYLGTFSKTFCPGLRLGWLTADADLHSRYVMVKQGADLHTSTLSQMQLARYLQDFDLDAAIAEITELYRRRRDVMLETMARTFPDDVRWTRPEGGLFLWVTLPEGISAKDLLLDCLEENVAFVPGGSFFPNGGNENTLRMNFSAMPEERIREGVERMGRVLHATVGRCEPAVAGV